MVHSLVPAGAISTEPDATPDSSSVAFTTTAVGSRGFCGSNWIVGGDSSMCTWIELVVEFCCPCGSIALFQAVRPTVWTPSPSTGNPLAGYASVPVSSTLQYLPPTPEGPAVVAASTVTAWLTHTLGLASFGVLSNTDTGSL